MNDPENWLGEINEPRCDLCGRVQGDSPYVSAADQPADWNGKTGNHRSCEDREYNQGTVDA